MIIQYINTSKYSNVFLVGDLHGCYSVLLQKLKELNFNTETDLLVSVGDLVDRGPENEKCLTLLDEKWFVAVRGNHEQFCIESYLNSYMANMHSIPNNGGAWLYNHDENYRQNLKIKLEELPYVIELNHKGQKIGVVHADVPVSDWNEFKKLIEEDGSSISRSIREAAIWSRAKISAMDTSEIENVDHVYFGHTPLREVTTLGNCTYIDTGAVFGHPLTVVKL